MTTVFPTPRSVVLVTLVLALLAVSGCARLGLNRLTGADRIEVNDTRFRARLSSERDNRRDFSVTVRPAIIDVESAQEAGRFEANKHCIRNFGSSDIAWTSGPELPIEEVSVVDDEITMTGMCTQR